MRSASYHHKLPWTVLGGLSNRRHAVVHGLMTESAKEVNRVASTSQAWFETNIWTGQPSRAEVGGTLPTVQVRKAQASLDRNTIHRNMEGPEPLRGSYRFVSGLFPGETYRDH